MPNQNGKGPRNAGSMTGRGNGNCGGYGLQRRQSPSFQSETTGASVPGSTTCCGPRGCNSGQRSGAGRCGGQKKRENRPQ